LSLGWRPIKRNTGVPARGEERVFVMRFQETILQRLGKALRAHWDDIAHEPLPRRLIELIQHKSESGQTTYRPAPQRRWGVFRSGWSQFNCGRWE